jgi:predicted nucleic acid-binding protein
MGLILDSSVLVAAERQGQNAREMLASVARKSAESEVGISVVTLIELAHGAARANTPDELQTAMPVHPVTVPVALRAGKIDGENQTRGVQVALADLLIGVTALELGFMVGTANLRDFSGYRACRSSSSSPIPSKLFRGFVAKGPHYQLPQNSPIP